ncbi:phosphoglycerate dehydrogenase [Macrococcus animalis]|uniref:phosphoglycerate dehydrogenase n=1 Tax=Macrococcus animalis TaxID=3395467 RepID=UPI0039BE516A
MYKIAVLDEISDTGLNALIEHPDFVVDIHHNKSEQELIEVLKHYDGALLRSATTLSAPIIENSSLKVIARAGVGVDNIDIDASTKKGVIVINAPDGNTISATEHTVAMILSLVRNIPQAHHDLQNDEWNRKKYQGLELQNKTLGIIGFGRIGQGVAKRLQSFGMKVLAYDPFLTNDKAQGLEVINATVEDIRDKADVITVHTPLTDKTRGMINADFFKQAKDNLLIVNVARGGIIVEADLINALDENEIRGAALDVFEIEPPLHQPIIHHPKIVVTPHLGASTVEAQEKVAISVAEEVIEIFTQQNVTHAINAPVMTQKITKEAAPFIEVAELAGKVATILFNEGPSKILLKYNGELALDDTSLLTRTIVMHILKNKLMENVNIINALYLLNEQHVVYQIEKNKDADHFTNYLEITLENDNNKVTIGATVLKSYGPRIVKINSYPVDFKPEAHNLYIEHIDQPGVIGKTGKVLGEFNINIGSMQLGRHDKGGQAIMTLTVDSEVNEDVITALKSIEGFIQVKNIEL